MLSQPTIRQKTGQATLAACTLAAFGAFSTYFCMYGFRKTISATTFDGINTLGISFKSALVISQVLGYMLSKFIGIRFISSLNPAKRASNILLLIGGAHLCLLLLALVPRPWNLVFIFGNGLCLGLIWGLVFSYIEGRRYTDFIALVLSINFIFSSGVMKSIGRYCIESWGVSEIFMPFVAGCLFLPLLFISVYSLERIPPPGTTEISDRGKRVALSGKERKALMLHFLPGLAFIILVNLLLTILRDIKDNYSVEIIRSLSPNASPAIYTRMETIAALAVFFLLLTISGFRNHLKSLHRQHWTMGIGFVTMGLCAYMLHRHTGDPISLLITYTIGLYLSYNTLQCLFLERFMAAFRIQGNIGFFFYSMDAIGYLGSCALILNKELFHTQSDWLSYFIHISLLFAFAGGMALLLSWTYFAKKYQKLQLLNSAS